MQIIILLIIKHQIIARTQYLVFTYDVGGKVTCIYRLLYALHMLLFGFKNKKTVFTFCRFLFYFE